MFVRDREIHNAVTTRPPGPSHPAATGGQDQPPISASALEEAAASEGVVDSFRREEAGGWDCLGVGNILEAGRGSDGVGERLVGPAGGHGDRHAAVRPSNTTAGVKSWPSIQASLPLEG